MYSVDVSMESINSLVLRNEILTAISSEFKFVVLVLFKRMFCNIKLIIVGEPSRIISMANSRS